MKKIWLPFTAVITVALLLSSCIKDLPCHCDDTNTKPTVKVFATGLNNPRGLKFGPDGSLYVAEGGIGGKTSTVGQCTQVPSPVGPYKGSTTGGRISVINSYGVRTTLTDQLPSTVDNFGEVSGVADVAFISNTLYALINGAGCSHGVPSVPNGVIKIKTDGSASLMADLSSYLMAHPVKNPEKDDFEPDGTPYSMIHVGDNLYIIEPNHGELIEVAHNGSIKRILDISASQGHIVPTVIAYWYGNFYVSNLNTFPIKDGSSSIYKITPGGDISVWATGFTTVLGLTVDKSGRLYVLENTTGNQFLTPNTGKIVRVNRNGTKDVIVSSGLSLPTGMTFGPDDKLYVSNNGFGPKAIGGGQVLQVDLHLCKSASDYVDDILK